MAEVKADPGTSPGSLGVREFQADLSGFLRQVGEGRSFILTLRGEALAEIRPLSPPIRPHRQPGALRGRIRMAPDFDTLPREIVGVMEGEEG